MPSKHWRWSIFDSDDCDEVVLGFLDGDMLQELTLLDQVQNNNLG